MGRCESEAAEIREVEKVCFLGLILHLWGPGSWALPSHIQSSVSCRPFCVNTIFVLLNVVWYGFLPLANKSFELSVISSGSPSLTILANLVPFRPPDIFIMLSYFMFYSTACSLKLPLQKMSNFLCVYCSFPSFSPCLILKYQFHEVRDFISFTY